MQVKNHSSYKDYAIFFNKFVSLFRHLKDSVLHK